MGRQGAGRVAGDGFCDWGSLVHARTCKHTGGRNDDTRTRRPTTRGCELEFGWWGSWGASSVSFAAGGALPRAPREEPRISGVLAVLANYHARTHGRHKMGNPMGNMFLFLFCCFCFWDLISDFGLRSTLIQSQGEQWDLSVTRPRLKAVKSHPG